MAWRVERRERAVLFEVVEVVLEGAGGGSEVRMREGGRQGEGGKEGRERKGATVPIKMFCAVVAMATGKACEPSWLNIWMAKVLVKLVLLKKGDVTSARPLAPPWDLSSSVVEAGLGGGPERGRERKSRKRYCWKVALPVDVVVV